MTLSPFTGTGILKGEHLSRNQEKVSHGLEILIHAIKLSTVNALCTITETVALAIQVFIEEGNLLFHATSLRVNDFTCCWCRITNNI